MNHQHSSDFIELLAGYSSEADAQADATDFDYEPWSISIRGTACEICGQKFETYDDLDRHIHQYHN